MPELPEVETIKNGLAKHILGKRVRDVSFDWPKSFPNDPAQVNKYLVGATINRVRRRAKVLIVDLDTNYSLVIHLKMTGQLVYRHHSIAFGGGHPTDSLVGDLPDRSTRVTIDFGAGRLYFNDQRKFGWVRLLPTPEVDEIDFFKKVGPEPLDQTLSVKDFIDRVRRRKGTSIKAAILDQSVIAGVGNIYADESLHYAKIHPASLVGDLADKQLSKLLEGIRHSLTVAIESGGSTDRNYVDAEGNRGSYLKYARVFRREGQPCPVCGTTIEKIRVAGRGTHVCPKCQRH
jgi:formamidopyrimidine-DNA glycosylase